MNSEEQEKYEKIIEEGYERLIKNRPGKPLEAFIYYLWDQLEAEGGLKHKDEHLKSFCQAFREGQGTSAGNVHKTTSASKTN